jgi:hypothetical protein
LVLAWGGLRIDRAVVETFLEAISPAGLRLPSLPKIWVKLKIKPPSNSFVCVERTRYEAGG